jgi:hypothetical protein
VRPCSSATSTPRTPPTARRPSDASDELVAAMRTVLGDRDGTGVDARAALDVRASAEPRDAAFSSDRLGSACAATAGALRASRRRGPRATRSAARWCEQSAVSRPFSRTACR